MGLTYHHLDEADVREAMERLWLEEWADLEANWPRGQCYGKQLTDAGWDAIRQAMPLALTEHDDEWLRDQLDAPEYWVPFLMRGGTTVDYNKTDAAAKLAIGEFNIAYVRGFASTLQGRGEESCVVYRASDAYVPRGECSTWENQEVAVDEVLSGHRVRYHPPPGDRQVFSVPSGAHCHHSVRSVG